MQPCDLSRNKDGSVGVQDLRAHFKAAVSQHKGTELRAAFEVDKASKHQIWIKCLENGKEGILQTLNYEIKCPQSTC